MAARVAQLGGRSAVRAGGDRAARDPRGARRGRSARAGERGLRVRASGSGHSFTDIALTDGVMVRCDRLDRVLSVDAEAGLVKVEAGIVLGELNRKPRRPRARVREPRRHRPPDARRLDRHRDARHRRALSQRLGADRGGRPGARRRQLAGDLGRRRPGRASPRRGSGSGRSGIVYAVTIRTVPAYTLDRIDRPRPLDETLADARRAQRGQRPLRVLRLPPHRHRALPREPAHRRAAAPAPARRWSTRRR